MAKKNEVEELEKPTELEAEKPTTEPTETQPNPEPEVIAEPEPGAADPSLDPFAEMADSLTAAKPVKQDHFVEATKQKRELENDKNEVEQNGQDWRFLKDKSGRYWSADICENKADPKTGLPAKTASGLWKLKRSATSKDRKKLPKKPPNIEAQQAQADEAQAVQISAEAEAASIQQSSIMTVKAIMAGYKAMFSKVSGEKAVSDVMGYQIGEGQFKVSVSDLIEVSGVEMFVKRGGGYSPPPELTFLGGLGVAGVAMYFHPSKPERKATLTEKAGVLWRRVWNRKKKDTRANNEQKGEGA